MYTIIILLGIALFLWVQGRKQGAGLDLVINISAGLICVGAMFFLVEQLFRWDPYLDLRKRLHALIDEVPRTAESHYTEVLAKLEEAISSATKGAFTKTSLDALTAMVILEERARPYVSHGLTLVNDILQRQSPPVRPLAAALLPGYLSKWEQDVFALQTGLSVVDEPRYYAIADALLAEAEEFIVVDSVVYDDPSTQWSPDWTDYMHRIKAHVDGVGQRRGTAKYIFVVESQTVEGKNDELLKAKEALAPFGIEMLIADSALLTDASRQECLGNCLIFFDSAIMFINASQVDWNSDRKWKVKVKVADLTTRRCLQDVKDRAVPFQPGAAQNGVAPDGRPRTAARR